MIVCVDLRCIKRVYIMDDRFQELKEALDNSVYRLKRVKDNLENDNRFFVDETFLNDLSTICKELATSLNEGTILYRARIYHNDDLKEKISKIKSGLDLGPFEGYDKENSFININTSWSSENRMNPEGINVLYAASDPDTASIEIQPICRDYISVANIQINENLKIVDFSKNSSSEPQDSLRYLSVFIQDFLTRGQRGKDYIFPQYIASYCKYIGYDGIAYKSKYYKYNNNSKAGINYSIFNYNKCEAISSKLYYVKTMNYEINKISDM